MGTVEVNEALRDLYLQIVTESLNIINTVF